MIFLFFFFFFFNDTATTEIYTLSLHDALPISNRAARRSSACSAAMASSRPGRRGANRSSQSRDSGSRGAVRITGERDLDTVTTGTLAVATLGLADRMIRLRRRCPIPYR